MSESRLIGGFASNHSEKNGITMVINRAEGTVKWRHRNKLYDSQEDIYEAFPEEFKEMIEELKKLNLWRK